MRASATQTPEFIYGVTQPQHKYWVKKYKGKSPRNGTRYGLLFWSPVCSSGCSRV